MTDRQLKIKLASLNGVLGDLRKQMIIEKIREKYDANDETAILRQRDTKPDEYEEYNTYAEACKTAVSAEIAEVVGVAEETNKTGAKIQN